jgi:hypothetical protein
MHEGDHSILDEEHDHGHPHGHKHPHPHDHTHQESAPRRQGMGTRAVAGIIVAGAVLLFLVWRFF